MHTPIQTVIPGGRQSFWPNAGLETKNIFFAGLMLAASGLISPPIALLGGLMYGFILPHPFQVESKRLSKFLLQASVVALGFGMNLHEVVRAGRSGFLYTAVSITVAMLLGLGFGYLLQVWQKFRISYQRWDRHLRRQRYSCDWTGRRG